MGSMVGQRTMGEDRGRRGNEFFGCGIRLDDVRDPTFQETAFCVGPVIRAVYTDDLTSDFTQPLDQSRRQERTDVIDEENVVVVMSCLLGTHHSCDDPSATVIQ